MCMCIYLLKLLLAFRKDYILSRSVPNWQALGAGLLS